MKCEDKTCRWTRVDENMLSKVCCSKCVGVNVSMKCEDKTCRWTRVDENVLLESFLFKMGRWFRWPNLGQKLIYPWQSWSNGSVLSRRPFPPTSSAEAETKWKPNGNRRSQNHSQGSARRFTAQRELREGKGGKREGKREKEIYWNWDERGREKRGGK
jgi:hypothetical protein